MANIIATKTPEFVEQAYGKNIVTLYDLDEDGLRFVLRVRDEATSEIVADLRQYPNNAGYAHFDLQKILQTQVSGKEDVETTPYLSTAETEEFSYELLIGFELGTGQVFIQSTVTTDEFGEFTVTNGRKDYDQLDWNLSDYVPIITQGDLGGNPFTVINNPVKALTDRHTQSVLGSQISDGKPTALTDTAQVNILWRNWDDDYTLTFANKFIDENAPDFFNGIDFFYVYLYNGSSFVNQVSFFNLVSQGGGPDVAPSDQLLPTGEYSYITLQHGASNPSISALNNVTHYYVAAFSYAIDNPTLGGQARMSQWYRVNIDNGECNDFDHVQVSWVNSFGFRDYFTFEKRQDLQITTDRETFRREQSDWNGPSVTLNSYSRGLTTYGQLAEEEWQINTRYLTDNESEYLKNLYVSPDVRVRFSDGVWRPVVITSNTWTRQTFRTDQMFQHQVTFKMANQLNLQNG